MRRTNLFSNTRVDHRKWLEKKGLLPKQIKSRREKLVASLCLEDYTHNIKQVGLRKR